MADVEALGFQIPEDVRLKIAELELELSEGIYAYFGSISAGIRECFFPVKR